MPKISCKKDVFFRLLGREMSLDELEELAFAFGIEVEEEEVPVQKEEKVKKGKQQMEQEQPKLVFEIAANRPDLLCVENLSYALRLHLGLEEPRTFTFSQPKERILVKHNTKQIRPYIVGAVLRNVTFDENSYNSFMDIQDKLHHNLCRRRKLVAIGTHDLDSIKGPFVYDARPPQDIKFKALKQTQEMDCVQLFEVLEKDTYLKPYLSIVRDSPVYPVILDQNGVVLSLPPIINGDHSKMSTNTKNIFIESTATDYQRAVAALACLVSGFSQYSSTQFDIEMVEVHYEESNTTEVTPQSTERVLQTTLKYVNETLGIQITSEEAVKLLQKMGIQGSALNKEQISVTVPFYRSDILQECDVAEDIGIAYGYNNIEMKVPESSTFGGETRLSKLSDMVREEVAISGFVECLNFVLCSIDELTNMINRKDDQSIVRISNSKSSEFQCARTTLIPPILKTLKTNAKSRLPIQLFEVADVVLKGAKTEGWVEGEGQVNAINRRRLCAIHSDRDSSGLDVIHGLLDQVMLKLKVENTQGTGYHIDKSNDTCFFPGLQAAIYYKDNQIGVMGVLHPQVLENIKWDYPAALIEIDLEPVFRDFI